MRYDEQVFKASEWVLYIIPVNKGDMKSAIGSLFIAFKFLNI